MKYFLGILVVFVFCVQINAQDISSSDPYTTFSPSRKCNDCQSINKDLTGIKIGIGFGVVKELIPRVDLTTHLSYQYWYYKINSVGLDYYFPYTIPENNHLFNLSFGQRFHFLNFRSSSFFTGTHLNLQTHVNKISKKFGLSIEPSLGWKKDFGKNNEFFMSLGYDQLLTSYHKRYKYRPGRLGFNFGFNSIIIKKVKTDEEINPIQ